MRGIAAAADGVVNFLKGLQRSSSTSVVDRELVGALGGSFPLVGAYMPNGYPGWATKFLLDALLHQCGAQRTAEGLCGTAASVATTLV